MVALCLLAATPRAGLASPALDRSDSMVVDGFSKDFHPDEALFGINASYLRDGRPCVSGGSPPCPLEEAKDDSQWGFFNDVNQIHVTWDAKFLYVAVDGITWNNNMMLFFDVTRRNPSPRDLGAGLPDLVNVNAWRRNISFANGFAPDFFVATWDGNATPQLWTYQSLRTVNQTSGASFKTAATFSSNAEGRAMEAAIPWSLVFPSDSTIVSPAYGDTVPLIPAGFDTLRLAACITAGPDGSGSPDSAPDNFSGFQQDGSGALLDNYAIIPLDLRDAGGQSQRDRVPDMPGPDQTFTIDVKARTLFLQQPPIKGIRFSIADVRIEQGVVSPEQGRDLEFRIFLDQRLSIEEAEGRSVSVSAEIFDLRGERQRVLFNNQRFGVLALPDRLSRWDGRAADGHMVPGGIYVLRVLLEPGQEKALRSFALVR